MGIYAVSCLQVFVLHVLCTIVVLFLFFSYNLYIIILFLIIYLSIEVQAFV